MIRNGASSKDKTKGTIFLLTAICNTISHKHSKQANILVGTGQRLAHTELFAAMALLVMNTLFLHVLFV